MYICTRERFPEAWVYLVKKLVNYEELPSKDAVVLDNRFFSVWAFDSAKSATTAGDLF